MTKDKSLEFIEECEWAISELRRAIAEELYKQELSSTDIVVDTPDGPERYVRLPPGDRLEAGGCRPDGIQDTPVSGLQPPAREEGVKREAYLQYGDGFIGGPGFLCDHSWSSIEMIVCRLNDLSNLATKMVQRFHALYHDPHIQSEDCQLPTCREWKGLCYKEDSDGTIPVAGEVS